MPKFLRLAGVFRFILNHPLNRRHKLHALGRFIRWQVGSRLAPGPVIIPFVEQTRLVARPGLMGATGIYYTGLYEFEEMAFALHVLRPGDRFVDVGAHIGAFSILAAGAVGADCLAIEPVPASFAFLQENINLNGLNGKIQPLNIGIAAHPGRLPFTTLKGAANGVALTGTAAKSGISIVEVEVQPLDALLEDWDLSNPITVLKVDVEGYEHEVIAGAAKTLADPRLVAILIELRGHSARYDFDEDAIHQRLLDFGFQPFTYTPQISPPFRGEPERGRVLTPLPGINRLAGTTLYLRDLALVQQRLANAPLFRVHGQKV
jgi:FkbM family methyltransferase